MNQKDLFSLFVPLLGNDNIATDAASLRHYGKDWLKDYEPAAGIILFPTTYTQVQEVVRTCSHHNLPLIPSGGRTGLSGGATARNGEVVLSLERLNKILTIDPISRLVVCEAGVVTEALQRAVAAEGFFFPIDFASKGSSQIGGNIATNAGGVRVIRWGNIRDWVVGLKVVAADGELLELNGALFKNQTGYDLRQLFIGSEGTLGVIVEATLKLTSPPRDTTRLFCAANSIAAILDTMARARAAFGTLSMFEYLSALCIEILQQSGEATPPFQTAAPHYALIEIETPRSEDRERIEEFFCSLIEEELLTDVTVSSSTKQAEELLAVRERVPEVLTSRFTVHKNDVSVPVRDIPAFCDRLQQLLPERFPGFTIAIFGHLGDGNLHLNILKPVAMESETFFAFCKEADHAVFEVVRDFHGSISAEHGIGLLKKDFLPYSRSDTEISLMRKIKALFDPKGILNPGKVVDLP